MKSLLVLFQLIVGSVLISGAALSQAPDAINYQGICKYDDGQVVSSEQIGVEISISEGQIGSGQLVYTEEHLVTTSEGGVFSIEIGRGTPAVGSFADIDWSLGEQYMEISIDTTGGTNYSYISASEFLSVPYSYYSDYADTANHAESASYADSVANQIDTLSNGYSLSANADTLTTNAPWIIHSNVDLEITDPALLESLTSYHVSARIYDTNWNLLNARIATLHLGPGEFNKLDVVEGNTYNVVIFLETVNGTKAISDQFTAVATTQE